MKRIIFSLITAILVCSLCGCGKTENTSPNMTVNIRQDSNGGSVTVYDGTEQRSFTVESGEVWDIGVSVEKEDGSVDIRISKADDSDNCIYRGTDVISSSFTVTADDPGDYIIYISAHNFTGKYGIELSKRQ